MTLRAKTEGETWACNDYQLRGPWGDPLPGPSPALLAKGHQCPRVGKGFLGYKEPRAKTKEEREEERGTPCFALHSATAKDIYLVYGQLFRAGGKPG